MLASETVRWFCICYVSILPPAGAGLSDNRVSVWIGLSDRATEGEFVWSDGSSLDYERWADEGRKGNEGF